MLFVSFSIEILTWSFLASSLLLCRALLGLYQADGDVTAIRTVFSLAVLASLMVAVPFSALVTFKVPGTMARRLIEGLPSAGERVVGVARQMAEDFRVSVLGVLLSPSGVPFAYTVGGGESVMVVSRGLVGLLDGDEIETVIAHELAHVKNRDASLNTIVAVYRRVLFFDPLIRLLERAICRENEFSADEFAARETKKPLSLASALLKISSAQSGRNASAANFLGLSILGSGRIPRQPNVKERIDRLMRLASEFERDDLVGDTSGWSAVSRASPTSP